MRGSRVTAVTDGRYITRHITFLKSLKNEEDIHSSYYDLSPTSDDVNTTLLSPTQLSEQTSVVQPDESTKTSSQGTATDAKQDTEKEQDPIIISTQRQSPVRRAKRPKRYRDSDFETNCDGRMSWYSYICYSWYNCWLFSLHWKREELWCSIRDLSLNEAHPTGILLIMTVSWTLRYVELGHGVTTSVFSCIKYHILYSYLQVEFKGLHRIIPTKMKNCICFSLKKSLALVTIFMTSAKSLITCSACQWLPENHRIQLISGVSDHNTRFLIQIRESY